MNRTALEDGIDARVRRLDAAPALDDDDRVRQAALLESLLASDPTRGDGVPPARLTELIPRPGRRPRRRLVLTAAAAAILTAAAVVLPLRGTEYAFASWTPRPTEVTPLEAAQATQACQDRLGTLGGAGGRSADALSPRLVERRGDWLLVLLNQTAADGFQYDGYCIAHLPAGSHQVPRIVASGAGGGGGLAPPTGHELVEGGVAQFGPDDNPLAMLLGTPRLEETLSVTSGQIGPDVVAVTLHAGGRTVEASVTDGTFAAWWPGPAFDPTTLDGPSGRGGPQTTITYDITLRDGTVLHHVMPRYS